jgi:sugar lactone lactonase YvrE
MQRLARIAGVCLVMLAPALVAQPNPYGRVADWPKLDGLRALGSVSDVYPDARGNVWVAERCGANSCAEHPELAPILAFDRTGRLVASFGAGRFVWPHGIYVDRDEHVWVTDGRSDGMHGHQVIEFDAQGRELMRLGEAGVTGAGPSQFSGPTSVVVAADGTIFVADGHELESNHRIVKFAADGAFLMAWGGRGAAPGQFQVPHALALDSRGRLFVADRDNNRIQIFTQDGALIDVWTQFGRPSGIFISADDTLYVADNQSNDERNPGWPRGIRVGSARTGTVTAFIPDPAFDPARAEETSAHGIAADAAGNVYGAEVWSRSIVKYARASR